MLRALVPCLPPILAVLLAAGCSASQEPPQASSETGTLGSESTPEPPLAPTPPVGAVEMDVDAVRADPTGEYGIVLLKERVSGRYLPIWVGPLEATAIAVELQGIPMSRPQTHDLLESVISHLDGRVVHVVITKLLDDTFYAKIVLIKDGDIRNVDARPSDAIALALRSEAPVFADPAVLEVAGLDLEPVNGESNDLPALE